MKHTLTCFCSTTIYYNVFYTAKHFNQIFDFTLIQYYTSTENIYKIQKQAVYLSYIHIQWSLNCV